MRPFRLMLRALWFVARGDLQSKCHAPTPSIASMFLGCWTYGIEFVLSVMEYLVGTRHHRSLFCPLKSIIRYVRTTIGAVLDSSTQLQKVDMECYLVDPASSHMLVSKIKPCMCKYELIQTVKLRMAH